MTDLLPTLKLDHLSGRRLIAPTLLSPVRLPSRSPPPNRPPLDVREPNEVALGNIPSSVNVPLSEFEKAISLDEGEQHASHRPNSGDFHVDPSMRPLTHAPLPSLHTASRPIARHPSPAVPPRPRSSSAHLVTSPSSPARRLHAHLRLPQARQAAAHHLLLPRRRPRRHRRRPRKARRLQEVSIPRLTSRYGLREDTC